MCFTSTYKNRTLEHTGHAVYQWGHGWILMLLIGYVIVPLLMKENVEKEKKSWKEN